MKTYKPGFRSLHSVCPFCKKLNIIADQHNSTLVVEEQTCDHFFMVVQGYNDADVIFQNGSNQKGGLVPHN